MATDYAPKLAVWELTMNCNLRCQHCGSSCEGPLPGELTPAEALDLADTLGRMGLRHITLSGGEPLKRPDWPVIASRLLENRISVAIITNGWLLDEAAVAMAARIGVRGFGISIDGLRETHDAIRKPGSFDRIMKAIDLAHAYQIPVTAVTCLHGRNLGELAALRDHLVNKRVRRWQLQAAEPMGNLLNHPDWFPDPSSIHGIVDFAHDTLHTTPIRVFLADNLGYYCLHETELRGSSLEPVDDLCFAWRGCAAGKSALGIRCNGDIVGCLSIRDDNYIEGNIRDLPLEELWHRPGAFAWNRCLTKSDLTGRCRTCQFGARCLAGCAGVKIARYQSTTENPFCAYHCAMEEEEKTWGVVPLEEALAQAKTLIQDEAFQSAEMLLRRLQDRAPDDIDVLNLLGYVHFCMENYPESLASNRRVLALAPENACAHKGLGLCLYRMGRVEEGVQSLRTATRLAREGFTDPFQDLAVVLAELERPEEALLVLEEGRRRSKRFAAESDPLYQRLTHTASSVSPG